MDADSIPLNEMTGAIVPVSRDITNRHHEGYQWETRFGSDNTRFSRDEYRAFLDVIRSCCGDDDGGPVDEIIAFMMPYPSSTSWERCVSNTEDFCEHGSFALQHFIQADQRDPRLGVAQEPRAWVLDNSPSSQDAASPTLNRALTNIELKEALQLHKYGQRFNENATDNVAAYTRRVYISNPNGASILALMRALPPLQVDGFRKLLSGYLTTALVPSLMLIDSEAVFSFVISGRSDNYWTAICLNDDSFDEYPRIDDDDITDVPTDPIIMKPDMGNPDLMWSPRSYALLALASQLEKIIEYHKDVQFHLSISLDHYGSMIKHGVITGDANRRLQAWRREFPEALGRVINFNTGLALQLSNFILEDLQVGQDEAFHGILWQSLQGDICALRSLRKIKSLHTQLRAIGVHFEHLKVAYESVKIESESQLEDAWRDHLRREDTDTETNNAQPNEDQNNYNTVLRIAIAGFGLQGLSLIAQVYASKPDKDDPSSLPGYLSLVIIFNIVCISGMSWFFWPCLSRYRKSL
ncbi:hypothetical protein FOFC_00557 [Fusarium oxysporum]|nr:hypothetical protein FOFC_00557 [Fusarium oxysporum]